MNLSVGQIVFVIPEKQTIVQPMQVVEEITKKMLHMHDDGRNEVVSETDYLLKHSSNSKYQLFSEIQGEIFETAEKAKLTMIERATLSITRHIENALKRANESFGLGADITNKSVHISEEISESAYVDLGNGLKGRIRLNN
jgi:hypothetical protein